MKFSAVPSLLAVFMLGVPAAMAAEPQPGGQTITRAGTYQTEPAPQQYFTGQVSLQRVFPANEHAQFTGALVTFQPGARSHWHMHTGGQHLVVTDGVGRTGTADGKVEEFRVGDVLWCPPGVKHWHGAGPDAPMTHMAITLEKDGKNTEWLEPVTDEQYNAK